MGPSTKLNAQGIAAACAVCRIPPGDTSPDYNYASFFPLDVYCQMTFVD